MKYISSIILTLTLLIGLTACGQTSEETNTPIPQATPTSIVLATPTPKEAPPTPTPKPTQTPSPTPEPPAETPTPLPTDAPTLEPTPTNHPLDVDMVLIPAGPFTMGSESGTAENGPAHTVDLPAFEIDKFEVTNTDFALFVTETNYVTDHEQTSNESWQDYNSEERSNHPVVKVTWNDAVRFCEWAGKRLPTEEEWEKAARGDDARTYPWGEEFDASLANVKDTKLRGTTAVGSFPGGASPYGVEDIAGNVWEWTATWLQPYPGNTVEYKYYGERFRVTSGGAWFEEAPQVTTFNRNAADPDTTANDDVGFRCVRDIGE